MCTITNDPFGLAEPDSARELNEKLPMNMSRRGGLFHLSSDVLDVLSNGLFPNTTLQKGIVNVVNVVCYNTGPKSLIAVSNGAVLKKDTAGAIGDKNSFVGGLGAGPPIAKILS